jgi:uncharacterized protein (TIGR03435 family)
MMKTSLVPSLIVGLALLTSGVLAQAPASNSAQPSSPAFEVATIKPVPPDTKAGRYIIMQGNNRFVAKHYTLKLMIAAAYDVSPKAISGGPRSGNSGWMDSDHYDIEAITPGTDRPSRDEQMAMLRNLLVERFQLTIHREPKVLSIYELEVSKGGPKLKPSAEAPGEPAALISTVYPDRIHLPAKNATMAEFASLLQRAVLDRPVVDKTALTGRYDFDLDWAPDETQFGGEVPVARSDAPNPPFFTAIEQQIGLKIEPTKGPVMALVVDSVQQPSAN